VKIPKFEGKIDPDKFLEWLHMVERILVTRMFLKIRRLSLLLSSLNDVPLFGGLAFVPKGL